MPSYCYLSVIVSCRLWLTWLTVYSSCWAPWSSAWCLGNCESLSSSTSRTSFGILYFISLSSSLVSWMFKRWMKSSYGVLGLVSWVSCISLPSFAEIVLNMWVVIAFPLFYIYVIFISLMSYNQLPWLFVDFKYRLLKNVYSFFFMYI